MKNRTYISLCALRSAASTIVTLLALASSAAMQAGDKAREPSLPSPLCDSLQVPDGNEVAFHVYAIGVQIYH